MGLKVVFPDLGVRESGLELIFLKPFEGWRRQQFYTFPQLQRIIIATTCLLVLLPATWGVSGLFPGLLMKDALNNWDPMSHLWAWQKLVKVIIAGAGTLL